MTLNPATDAVFPIGYAGKRVTFNRLREVHEWRMHPEYARRLFAAIWYLGGAVGIGGGWRSTVEQAAAYAKNPSGFAPPGLSFHEFQQWAASNGFPVGEWYAAVDLVGDLDAYHAVCAQFGLIHFADVNNEPWHTQFAFVPHSVKAWKAGGRLSPPVWPGFPEGGPAHVDPVPPPPPPSSITYTERIMQNLPALKRNVAGGDMVKRAQALCNVRLGGVIAPLVVDGHFGPATDAAVKRIQSLEGLVVDGIIGPQTWAALLGVD